MNAEKRRSIEARKSDGVAASSGKVFAAICVLKLPMRSARRYSFNQPKISGLANYCLEGFSVERLNRFLNALDQDVEVVIRRKPNSRKSARILVTAA